MNAFERLLSLPDAEKKARGLELTPAEIAQQPATWKRTARVLVERRDELLMFLREAGLSGRREAVLMLAGAGTSEFVGNAIQSVLRAGLRREVVSVPTTHLVTHAAASFVPGHAYVLLSFARSGNSPESVASYRLARRVEPSLRQMVITCNQEGALAEEARNDDGALCVVLPEETNDRSLVMTSSFSNMALAGVGLTLLKSPRRLLALADRLAEGGERILRAGDTLAEFAGLPFARACFLGSNALCGTMQECHLKMQEMTEGRVASRFESFLGLRHGPQVFVNGECVVVAALSSDAAVRRYELDMLRELKAKRQGCGVLAVCDRATSEIRAACTHAVELYPEGEAVEDGYRVMTDVMVGQILGVFKSLAVGLKPDNPSTSGTINRVVQGVTIYEDAARGTGNAEGQREHERRDEGAR